jgi:hypothetical protein
MPARTTAQKLRTVLQKNTYFDFNPIFEEAYDARVIRALGALLANVHREIVQHHAGMADESVYDHLLQQKDGLKALLALTGFSQERLKRLITVVRLVNDPQLNALMYRANWSHQDADVSAIAEWGWEKLTALVREDAAFRWGIVSLFFHGAANEVLIQTLPPFDLRKLDLRKLSFEVDALVDTLVRYGVHGSYNAQKDNNAERLIEHILESMGIGYAKGELPLLLTAEAGTKRRMDFIVPDKENPLIIIESSFLATTTSSGQGDKAKTELAVADLIRRYYPQAVFIGFVDGAGWYARQGDLERMVQAYADVFTFHPDELKRFEALLKEVFDK